MTLEEVPNKQLFRVGEVAAILCVHECTVRIWVEKGYLKTVNSPTYQRRITRASILHVLQTSSQS